MLHLIQAPPSLDEDNFPSLATSPGPSPRASVNSPSQTNGKAMHEGTKAEMHHTDSQQESTIAMGNASDSPKVSGKLPSDTLPSVWGGAGGSAHKATTTPEKKKSSQGWVSKAGSMSSQQKAQAANSKLQAGAPSFKSKSKGPSKVPWVETGVACNTLKTCKKIYGLG